MKVGKGAIAVVIVALILTAITVYSIVNGAGGNIGMGVLAAILFSLAGAGMITYVSGSVAEITMENLETENKAAQK